MTKIKFIFLIALYLILKGNFLFSQELDSLKNELKEDKDSVVKEKPLYSPLKKHGALFLLQNNAHQFIPKHNIQKNDYLDLGEILIQETGMYPLHFASLGLNNSISFASGLNNQLQFNGVSLSNPINLNSNFAMYSPEYTENIEVYTGLVSTVFSDNTNSTLINMPEIIYNTNKPFFRFWAADTGEDYLSIDGVFSQNIAPNLNFNFGIRSLAGEGVYENDEVRNRSLRMGLRWNFDSLQNMSITWQHNNHFMDLYGGISANSITDDNEFDTDPLSAISRFPNNSQRDVNNNLIINYTKLGSDSTSAINSTAYVINDLIYDFTNRTIFSGTFYPDRPKYTLRKIGANFSYEKEINKLFLKGKFDLHNSSIENNLYSGNIAGDYLNYSATGFATYNFSNFQIASGLRYSKLNDNNLMNYGVKSTINLSKSQYLILDYSHSEIAPNLIYNNLNKEINDLIYLRYINNALINTYQADIYFRKIDNMFWHSLLDSQLTYSNDINTNTYFGGNLNLKIRLFEKAFFTGAEIFTILNNNISFPIGDSKELNPLIHSYIDTYISIPKGRSRADLGVRFSFLSENNMPTYFPDISIFIDNQQAMPAGLARNEIYARLRLGSAYLKLTLTNFLGNDYFYIPMYNSLPNNFRMSFNWTFS